MIFCMKININVFYKLVVTFLLVIARHAQSTENSKIVNKHADKYQTILQVDTINLGGHGQACPNYPKLQVCKIFAISQERSE